MCDQNSSYYYLSITNNLYYHTSFLISSGECVADYDPVEGVILASTGSEDLIAGTTAVAAVMSVGTDGGDELIILNCGDSRALLVGAGVEDGQNEISSSSVVYFSTRDHSPQDKREEERLK